MSVSRKVTMRALSIRQPFAEAILRRTKCIEYRSGPTRIRGRVYIYASATPSSPAALDLPRGVIIGTVEVFACTGSAGRYEWHLRGPRRLVRPRKPLAHPQPVWFNPFP